MLVRRAKRRTERQFARTSGNGSSMMKYKNIPSALHNFADSFTSDSNCVAHDLTMAYLARRAIAGAEDHFTFDILAGTAAPSRLAESPVDEAVREYALHFPKHLAR